MIAPFVPTPPRVLRLLRRLLPTLLPGRGRQPVAYDAGCGEGLVAAALASTGAYTLCVELDPARLRTALRYTRGRGLGHLVEVVESDITVFTARRIDLVYMYLMPGAPDLVAQNLPEGATVVSLDYELALLKQVEAYQLGPRTLYIYKARGLEPTTRR